MAVTSTSPSRWFRIIRAISESAVVLELAGLWLALGPRRVRRATFVVLTALQLAIALTGNHALFNVLTMVDSLWLLDDEPIMQLFHTRRLRARRAPWWRRHTTAAAALPVLALALAEPPLGRRTRPLLKGSSPRRRRRASNRACPRGAPLDPGGAGRRPSCHRAGCDTRGPC